MLGSVMPLLSINFICNLPPLIISFLSSLKEFAGAIKRLSKRYLFILSKSILPLLSGLFLDKFVPPPLLFSFDYHILINDLGCVILHAFSFYFVQVNPSVSNRTFPR